MYFVCRDAWLFITGCCVGRDVVLVLYVCPSFEMWCMLALNYIVDMVLFPIV
jgi:hypothetical protein